MKMTIKEILEKCEKKDKVSFKGTVKAVYDGAENKTKYTNFKQNLIIKDDTAEIRVVYNYKEKEEEYPKDIVGKEIEIVNGVFSEYVNQKGETMKNIFGKLTFKEGEEPIIKRTGSNIAGSKKSSMPLIIEVRGMALKHSIEFWNSRVGEKIEEEKVIKTADKFYTYLTGKANVQTEIVKDESIQKKDDDDRKELKGTRSTEQVIKPSPDNITLINEIMILKEEKKLTAGQWEGYRHGKDVKEMTIKELEELKKILKEWTDDIPF